MGPELCRSLRGGVEGVLSLELRAERRNSAKVDFFS